MDKLAIESFLKKPYPGWKDFMQGFIVPLFEGADVDDKRGADQLNDDLRNMAKRCGIVGVRYLAEVSVVSTDFKVFDVTVSDQVCLQRNRVTVQQLIRKIVGQGNAFMAFHYKDDQSEWRFSFCQRIADAASNAKRHTFLLGEEQNVRTVTANFMQLRETLSAKGYLEDADLIKCFDVEALSKEFFAKYKKFYEKFVDYASKHDLKQLYKRDEKAVRDYIKKMMGRLVFLQFLQKKGWLGVPKGKAWGEGDRQFLQNLFKAATPKQKDAFLDEILEHIFFHALNDSSRADGELFDTKVKAYGSDGGKVKVPYLNGGLFESDQEDDSACAFPKAYFSNPEDAENNPGLLDFFSQYNFTIDENDPTEAEVGVDPEMLSCIFENLLEDNKDKGAYYTPKAIVEYMCRESLTAYLQTEAKDADKGKIAEFVKSHDAEPLSKSLAKSIDGKLRKVKICDPAIGSGAFPMGLLRELQLCRTALEDESKSAAEIKKEIIQNNIYGVDIEKGAVDIARLRFWLSLVVDEPTPAALPNLDFKIMQGNSLLESYKGVDLGGLLSSDVPQKKKKVSQGKLALGKCVQTFTQGELAFGGDSAAEIITTKMREYYDESDHEKKAKIMDDINAQVKGYIKNQLGSAAPEKEIDALNPQNDQFFLWHTWFNDAFANGGFDIVIGNPPYIKEYVCKAAFDGFREISPYYLGKMDLWYGFACHGIDMLAPHGQLCFIAQNNWTTSAGARRMRRKVISDTRIVRLVDFNEYMVFSEDNPSGPKIQTMIMQFERDVETDDYTFDHRWLGPGATKFEMRQMLAKAEIPIVKYIEPTISRVRNIEGLLTFSGDGGVFDKISQGKVFLEDGEIAQGIVPNPDVVNKRNRKHLTDQSIKVGEGVFVVPLGKFAGIGEDEAAYIKPMYEPYQIDRYKLDDKVEKQILYITKQNWKNDAPTLARHLYKYREIMELRRENQNGRLSYMHLHWPRDERFFSSGEKILAVRKCVGHPIFTYTTKSAYVMMAVNVIQTERWNMRFLTGVLNSRLIAYWLRHKGKMQGGNYQVDKEPLMAIPLPELPKSDQKPIATLVDKILAAKAKDAQADTSELESQIDALVYDLYGLTEEEIAVVEGR